MSNWKVSKETIEVFEHPNAEKLQLGKVGTYQVVVQKGLYNGGETVVFAPEKSVLTGLLEQEYKTYLSGPDKNRVKAVMLRNELSCGIIIPNELILQITGKDISELPEGEDLSEVLGITKYVAPIPVHLAGAIEQMQEAPYTSKHDCEQFGVYASNFVEGERVVVTEKMHGSQITAYLNISTGYKFVSTKGYVGQGLCLTENPDNAYWMAVNNADLWTRILTQLPDLSDNVNPATVQVFGELVPCQGANWSYGFDRPTMRVFDLRINGNSVPYDQLDKFRDIWVPIIYDGPYNAEAVRKLREGKEQVSGKELNIREGVVCRPYEDRRAADGTRLMVKIINPAYKETGEEIN